MWLLCSVLWLTAGCLHPAACKVADVVEWLCCCCCCWMHPDTKRMLCGCSLVVQQPAVGNLQALDADYCFWHVLQPLVHRRSQTLCRLFCSLCGLPTAAAICFAKHAFVCEPRVFSAARLNCRAVGVHWREYERTAQQLCCAACCRKCWQHMQHLVLLSIAAPVGCGTLLYICCCHFGCVATTAALLVPATKPL
jgi:hypothetical protein